uniref:Uncharacterized protein n=1 Tax=Schistosoma haematobium TaxID=6185 RepID=A0A095BVU9_SCHHA
MWFPNINVINVPLEEPIHGGDNWEMKIALTPQQHSRLLSDKSERDLEYDCGIKRI